HRLATGLPTAFFAPRPFRAVPRGYQPTRRRIPTFITCPIQNHAEPMRIFAQHCIQTTPACWRQDFAPIVLADRGDSVCVENAAFEKIQSSKKLDAVKRKVSLWQIGKLKIESPKTALVSHVMNGQYRVER